MSKGDVLWMFRSYLTELVERYEAMIREGHKPASADKVLELEQKSEFGAILAKHPDLAAIKAAIDGLKR
jgi:hypothetical protein